MKKYYDWSGEMKSSAELKNEYMKYYDWKGNEIKAGMTIYFVRTKPFNIGRMGLSVPGVGDVWETEEAYQERINQDVWELSHPYQVVNASDRQHFFICREIEGVTCCILFEPEPESIIAIKGISDTKDSKIIIVQK